MDFFKLEGLEGNSTDKAHQGWFDLLFWDLGPFHRSGQSSELTILIRAGLVLEPGRLFRKGTIHIVSDKHVLAQEFNHLEVADFMPMGADKDGFPLQRVVFATDRKG